MKPLFICYAKCTTCQKARKWLDENQIAYDERPIKEQNPTADELRLWQRQSGLPEMLSLLATDGMLVKRPLLVTGKTVVPGFKADAWKQALEKEE